MADIDPVRIQGDPYSTVRATGEAMGLDPKGPAEWLPFKMQCPVVHGHGRSVVVVDGLDGRAVIDCGKGCRPEQVHQAMGLSVRDVEAPSAPSRAPTPPTTNGHAPAPVEGHGRTLRERRASDIPMRHVEWGFHPYLPLGKVTIIAGAPGQGKSQLTLMVAALVTIGGLPGALAGTPKNAVIITGEDDPEDTVVPRLLAAGADLDRCRILDVRTATGETDLLTLPTEGGLLRDYVRTHDVGLVILDPISSFMDADISTYRNVDVRRALSPLKLMAEDQRLISLVVQHLNKGADTTEPLARITDSGAYVQMARSVLMMGPHPDDEDGDRGTRKLLVVAKSNLAPPGDHGLDLELTTTTVRDDAGEVYPVSMVALGEASRYGAEDLFLTMDARSEIGRAQAWLHRLFAGRWLPREDVDAAAKRENVSQATLRRALSAVGKRRKERGTRYGRTYWTHNDNLTPPPWEDAGQLDPARRSPKPDQLEQLDLVDTSQPGQLDQLDQLPGTDAAAQVDSLAEYRRRRDAMLGERWEDDDDA